jgi:uncharacterized protein
MDRGESPAQTCETRHPVREAKLVFQDARRIERLDDSMDYGEERIIVIGMAKGRLLHVVYVERQRAIRLISARTTERAETDDYYTA